jgi:hypothetical protein
MYFLHKNKHTRGQKTNKKKISAEKTLKQLRKTANQLNTSAEKQNKNTFPRQAQQKTSICAKTKIKI